MTPSQVIVLAIPVFLLAMAVEFAVGRARGNNVYRLNDAINSMSVGVLSQLGGLFSKLLAIGLYAAVYQWVALFPDQGFWRSWYGVLLALLFYDFCYYWHHRAGHEVALFWAAHVVHHQSQSYNLSTALRQTSSGVLLGWMFYLPMAVAGVPPLIFGIVALVDLLYQFWVHTELVGKLGWFDRVFCAPSNHRVHHAVNDRYLDRNYGGILIVWDRMFGSFREEGEKCVYGTRSPLRSWDPLWANAEVYWSLMKESWRTPRWSDKLRVWLKPPGWRAAGMAEPGARPAFDIGQVELFDPALTRGCMWFASLQFALLLAGVMATLWYAGSWSMSTTAVCSATLVACYWAMGAVLQNRLAITGALLVQSAALATATSALGLADLHHLFKPLTMVIAVVLVLRRPAAGPAPARREWLLVAALLASLAGDVFLMLPANLFIPGLASFLVAHLFYITLLRRGQSWFPSRPALAASLLFGAAMYALLWRGLGDPVLKAAVAAYVTVIALMAAQAIGRATVLRDAPSIAVALGACCFMLSDSLIAVNRFVAPVPMAGLWVLATYYAAQILIVLNVTGPRDA